ncbi:hypothetical protein EON64_21015 [archaeon]|nr:MAG: hypothetical protein EON64_21015 [archaeon]
MITALYIRIHAIFHLRSKDEGLFSALYAQIDEAAATSISTKVSAAKAIAFIYECADKVHPGLRNDELVGFISDERNEVEAAMHAMQKISK